MSEAILYGEPLKPRVMSVDATDDYCLYITFTNGEKRVFDARPLLSLPAFKLLKNISFFKSVDTGFGTIVWPMDIDYCPDTLYEKSIPI
jgi:hypothetical protein